MVVTPKAKPRFQTSKLHGVGPSVAFCTGVSYCRNGDLVLRKVDCEIIIDCWGHVFDRGQFDSNDELKEVAQQESKDGYYFVNVNCSSQFIHYIFMNQLCNFPLFNGLKFQIILYFGRNS